MSAVVSVARGGVYISADTYARYFNGVDAVALIVRDKHLHIMPVMHMASGGALLKIRNAAGDRVVSAPDLFAAYNLDDWAADEVEATWSSEHAALTIPLPSA
ncbi:MAG: hypothetical protein K0U74_02905 [Alphaproteobacteria bacterium]|nr:hypothetical protein [Alphaproteobacteria bacterium]